MADKKFLRSRNLDIIKNARKHLDKPKRYRDLYFIPDYEKAVILRGLDLVEKNYYDVEPIIVRENKEIYKYVKEITKGREEKNDDWCVVPVEGVLKIFDSWIRAGDGTKMFSPSPDAIYRGTYDECDKFVKASKEASDGQ